MLHHHGVINLLWMLVGIWMGVLIARALGPDGDASRVERVERAGPVAAAV